MRFDERVEIPQDLRSLAAFRRWAKSDEFPEQGRFDYLGDRIEVHLSPQDLFREKPTHPMASLGDGPLGDDAD